MLLFFLVRMSNNTHIDACECIQVPLSRHDVFRALYSHLCGFCSKAEVPLCCQSDRSALLWVDQLLGVAFFFAAQDTEDSQEKRKAMRLRIFQMVRGDKKPTPGRIRQTGLLTKA